MGSSKELQLTDFLRQFLTQQGQKKAYNTACIHCLFVFVKSSHRQNLFCGKFKKKQIVCRYHHRLLQRTMQKESPLSFKQGQKKIYNHNLQPKLTIKSVFQNV